MVQWFALLSHTQCRFEPWPLEFTRSVFVRVKSQFLPTVQRNIGQELPGAVWVCGVFICVSSIINCQPVVSVSPPAARRFRLHRLWPWMGVRSKENRSEKNNNLFMTALSCVQGSDVSASDLWGYFTYCLFLFFRLGKLQDSQKKLCIGPWRSRSGSAVRPSTTFWR